MRHKVDKIKGEVERDEFSAIKEVDPFKLIGKNQSQQQSNGSNPGS